MGRRISKKLNAMGIKTALDLSEQSTWIIRKHFNVVLERTVRELRGEPCLDLEEFAPTKQEIVCSRSFGERVTEYEQVRRAICSYAARGAEVTWRAPVLPLYLGVRKDLSVRSERTLLRQQCLNDASHTHSGLPRHYQRRGKVPRQNLEGGPPLPESWHYARGLLQPWRCPAQFV